MSCSLKTTVVKGCVCFPFLPVSNRLLLLLMMDIKSNLTNNLYQCSHNNKGYCKFGNKCHFQHFHKLCSKPICKEKECPSRHPKLCKNRDECKFFKKNICAYRHENLHTKDIIHNKNINEEINALEDDVKRLQQEIVDLKDNIQMKEMKEKKVQETLNEKTESIEKLLAENDRLKDTLTLLEKENVDLRVELIIQKKIIGTHKIQREVEELSTCGQCAFICETEVELKKHTENCHGYLSCDICDEFECEWDENDAMETHKELFHEFKCTICDFKTTTEKGLNIHRGAKHKTGLQVQSVKEICDKCSLTFASKETLMKHKSGMHTATLTF